MMVTLAAMNSCHLNTAQCAKGAEVKWSSLAEEGIWEGTYRAFQAYGRTLNSVTFFECLGSIMTA